MCRHSCTATRSRRIRTGRARTRTQPEILDTSARSRRNTTWCATSVRRRGIGRALGRARPRTGGSTPPPATLTADFLISATGVFARSEISGTARPGHLRGQDVPLAALGSRPRPHRGARRGDRHRRVGGAVRPGDPAEGRPSSPCSSGPRRGSCRGWTAPTPPWSARLAPRYRWWARRFAGGTPMIEGFGLVGFVDNRFRHPYEIAGPAAAAPSGPRSATAQEADPRLHDRMQARDLLRRLSTRARPGQCRGRHRRGSPRCAPHSIVTADGVEHPIDTIIYGTGFTSIPSAFERFIGRDGRIDGRAVPRHGRRAIWVRRSPGSRTSSAPSVRSARPETSPRSS